MRRWRQLRCRLPPSVRHLQHPPPARASGTKHMFKPAAAFDLWHSPLDARSRPSAVSENPGTDTLRAEPHARTHARTVHSAHMREPACTHDTLRRRRRRRTCERQRRSASLHPAQRTTALGLIATIAPLSVCFTHIHAHSHLRREATHTHTHMLLHVHIFTEFPRHF